MEFRKIDRSARPRTSSDRPQSISRRSFIGASHVINGHGPDNRSLAFARRDPAVRRRESQPRSSLAVAIRQPTSTPFNGQAPQTLERGQGQPLPGRCFSSRAATTWSRQSDRHALRNCPLWRPPPFRMAPRSGSSCHHDRCRALRPIKRKRTDMRIENARNSPDAAFEGSLALGTVFVLSPVRAAAPPAEPSRHGSSISRRLDQKEAWWCFISHGPAGRRKARQGFRVATSAYVWVDRALPSPEADCVNGRSGVCQHIL